MSTTSKDIVADESNDLAELNDFLACLSDVYPEHDVGLCRRLLLTASKESRLEAAAVALAELPPAKERYNRRPPYKIAPWECFRTNSYQAAVARTL